MRATKRTAGLPRKTAAGWERLTGILREMDGALVAFSGGVDSALLLRAAAQVLGRRILAVTAATEVHTPAEIREARALARALGVRHRVVRMSVLDSPEFVANPPDRCYHCKRRLFGRFLEMARTAGLRFVLDGSNADDASDFRPGERALRELGVRSPLREAGLGKAQVRLLSRHFGLPTADRPSLACLASRFPYGTKIRKENLRRVAAAEEFVRGLGAGQVRVRHHGDLARVEVPPEVLSRLVKKGVRERLVRKLKELGYTYVTIDLEGYRTGSLNEALRSR